MKRLIGVFVVTAAAVVPTAGLVIPSQTTRRSERAGTDDRGEARAAVDRMADVRPRPRRHALLAADADHARQRQPAAGRLGLSHASRTATGRRRRPRRCGSRTRPRTRTRRFGLCRERDHASRRQRRDVHHDPLWARRGARPDHGQGGLGVSGAGRQSLDARRRVPGPEMRKCHRRSSLPPATAGSTPSTPRPASQPRPSATRAAST